MKLNKRLLILLIPLLTGIFCAAYASYSLWQQTHFSCDSQLTVVGAKGTEEIILHFSFSGESGSIDTRGKYVPHGSEAIPISNKINFTFWREGDSLIMVSNDTNRLPKISPPELKDAPDFFTTRERGIRFKVIDKNPGGYIFLYENTPTLYCSRSQ